MEVAELAPGLWRWTAGESACFYVETGDATLLVDPALPAGEEERLWRALDRDVARRGLPVAVVLTGGERDAAAVCARYGGEIRRESRPDAELLAGPGAPPVWLPSHRALAVGAEAGMPVPAGLPVEHVLVSR